MALIFCLTLQVLIGCNKSDTDTSSHYTPGRVKPEITSVDPLKGIPGTIVTITGKYFDPSPSQNKVYFSGSIVDAEIIAAGADELKVKVPADAATGHIVVKVGSLGDTSAMQFTVEPEPASITSFTPTQGPFGTAVTITGKKFGSDIKVLMNGIEGNVISKSSTQIIFNIPANTTLTSHVLTVVSDGDTLHTTNKFTVTASGPYATWVSKQISFTPGASVFINGLSFVYKNKIYWGFTAISFLQNVADYVVFDPSQPANGWVLQNHPPADMAPARLQHAVALVHDDKVYIGTGLTTDASNAWWQFDPESNTSTRLTDYPEATAGALYFVVNNTMYVGFGGISKSLYRFDPTANNGSGNWTLAATGNFNSLHTGNAFVLGNDVFMGRALIAVGQERKAIFRFNQPNQLTRMTDMPDNIPMNFTPTFTIGNKGYFVVNKKVWEYTPDANGGTWRMVLGYDDAPVIRHVATVTVNGAEVVYGWNSSGDLYEFKIN